jgi:hypothetical protein
MVALGWMNLLWRALFAGIVGIMAMVGLIVIIDMIICI